MDRAETLVCLGFWPVTPVAPTTAIDLRLMDRARSFLLEGPVAMKKFCAATADHIASLPHYAPQTKVKEALYRALLQCAPQHRQFIYDVQRASELMPDFPDGSQCPICVETRDTLPQILSLDGNFRLVRKRSAGPSYCPPQHGTKFFLRPDEVQPYLLDANQAANVDVSIIVPVVATSIWPDYQ